MHLRLSRDPTISLVTRYGHRCDFTRVVTPDRRSGAAQAVPGRSSRGHPWPRMPLRTDQPSPSTFEGGDFVL